MFPYKNLDGLFINEKEISHLFKIIGKTEDQCREFFGSNLWEANGFASHWLDMTVAMKEWVTRK